MNESMQQQSERLEQLVVLTRRRLRRNAVLAGLCLSIIAMVGWLAVAAVLDMLLVLPVPARLAVWAVLWTLVVASLAAMVLWPTFRPMKLEQIAFRIENIIGRMHNRLVTVIDLRRTGRIDARAEPFAGRLIEQTTQRLAGYRVDAVADPKPVRHVALAAAATVVLTLLLLLAMPLRMSTAVMRVLLPRRPIPPVSSVQLTAHPGDAEVLQGDPLRVWATARPGDVEQLILRLQSDDGKTLSYPMQREGEGTFAFTLSAVNTSYDYRIAGGGTWTVPSRITMVRRPVIDKLAAEVQLPDCMKLPQRRPVDERLAEISAPAGATIHLAAIVTGDPTEGSIHLFEADTLATQETQSRETLWFDDDLPADAELSGKWRWTGESTYSGTRAHTFSWARKPYGFRTRLVRLAVGPQDTFFLYARLDTAKPPARLTVRVPVEGKTHELLWDSPQSPLSQEEKQGKHYLGHLPSSGSWRRLEAPGSIFEPDEKKPPAQLAGLSFEIDDGAILFDRAGTLRQVTREVKKTELKRVATLPMERDELTGRWTGSFLAVDGHFTVAFRNHLGHPSAPIKPIPVIATADQAPTVVVERPGRDLTLAEPQTVPLTIRVFDDYGVADVSIQTGAGPDDLADTRSVAEYGEPKTSRLAVASLDARAMNLAPGQSVTYRVLARDFAGQETVSEPFRIEIATPEGDAAQQALRDRHALGGILEDIGQLVELDEQLSVSALALIDTLPEGADIEVSDAGVITLLNPDGTSMTADEIRELLTGWEEDLTDEERRELAETREQIRKERGQLLSLSQSLFDAAGADQAMLILPADAEALRAMAARAREMGHMMPALDDQDVLDEELLAWLDSLRGFSDEGQDEMRQLQQQLQHLMVARQSLAASPAQSQRQLDAIMAQFQAQRAMRQIRALDGYLQSQQQLLQQMRQRVAVAREETEAAAPPELDELSRQQQEELDPEALELVQRARELLAKRLTKMRENQELLPPGPWAPPGRREEVAPVEQDTPEEDPQENQRPPDLNAVKRQIDDLAQEEELDWWDMPVDVPQTPFTLDPIRRFQGRDMRPVARPDARRASASATPRQMLMEHQDELHHALTANSNEIAGVQDELGRTMSQLQRATSEMRGTSTILGSPGMRQAMGMAGWAAAGAFAKDWSRQGVVFLMDIGAYDAVPVPDATLYRLPPWLRQPLLQGMQERGPEAYQPLIDAYYRQLSEEVEK